MGLELYLDLLSQPCRAVYIFAKKIGVPFELRIVELLKGQHCSQEFIQVNPLRKVPVLKDGDFTLAESVAILLYLSRKYEAPDHWYPQDLQACARVDEYLAWQHTSLRRSCSMVLWQKMMLPQFLGERVPPEALAATMAELERCLQLLEDKFLKDDDFLAGPRISVADLVAITELMHLPLPTAGQRGLLCLPNPPQAGCLAAACGGGGRGRPLPGGPRGGPEGQGPAASGHRHEGPAEAPGGGFVVVRRGGPAAEDGGCCRNKEMASPLPLALSKTLRSLCSRGPATHQPHVPPFVRLLTPLLPPPLQLARDLWNKLYSLFFKDIFLLIAERKGEGETSTMRTMNGLPPACLPLGIKPATRARALDRKLNHDLLVHKSTLNY
ncbi:uncharacterized protein LOC118710423 isoform X1 [Pipistrellus kuhlii]|uniref:uncharacterized protein LOC118710423 isoform X1 n=1 Tax=Pipistrellus kuhlii TaxID=59472 RepID=UPI001E274BD5|nr:uncharacterized protein LOC118710423 isoform X1 [Pipistrellus kuhlii]